VRTLSTVGEESSLLNISTASPTPSLRRLFAAKKALELDPTRRDLGRDRPPALWRLMFEIGAAESGSP